MASPPKKSIARSVGEFFGHVVKGVKADPRSAPQATTGVPAARRETTSEEVRSTPAGPVIFRRTVVEEVIFPKPEAPSR